MNLPSKKLTKERKASSDLGLRRATGASEILIAPKRTVPIPKKVLDRIDDNADRDAELLKLTVHPAPSFKRSVRLHPNEWNFWRAWDGTEEEREMCLKYELSREVLLWRQLAYNHRRSFEHKSLDDQWERYYELITLFPCLDVAFYFPEWPETPWLSIDPAIRKQSLGRRYWESLRADHDAYSEEAVALSKSMEVKKRQGKAILYTHLAIDLNQPNSTIKSDFSEWLEHARKKTAVKAIERRGTRSAADVLKALGAYRLLSVMKWDKAEDELKKHSINSYHDQATWSKAEELASHAIRKFSSQPRFGADVSVVIGPKK